MLLVWGSFLNVVAHRLIRDESIIYPRSRCPHCKHTLPWYDLIPVVAWFILQGHCRFCKQPISILYPVIELLTVISLTLLFCYTPPIYFVSYFLFFSALIVTIRTDLEMMLISRYVTLFLVPFGWFLAACGLLFVSPLESILGSLCGYGLLWVVSFSFLKLTGRLGIGQGDIELLAFIGAFCGIYGCWVALLVGSLCGSLIGGAYLILSRSSSQIKIPFGPFLAAGAMIYVLFHDNIIRLLLL